MKILASSLSGNETACPIPSSHDRLKEVHFFLHKMAETYHEPDPFRYHLHAFIQSFESTLAILDIETQNDGRFNDFREKRQAFVQTETMRKLNSVRDALVHLESLVPDSRVTAGWFKYGKPKLCFKSKIHPFNASIEVLASFRNAPSLVNPHRMWECEEVGILREWRLSLITDEELVSFCSSRFEELVRLSDQAHKDAGSAVPEGMCSLGKTEYQIILESEFFPEVLAAWEGPPTHLVTATTGSLAFRQHPSESSQLLHSLAVGTDLRGWVCVENTWTEGFRSILIAEIGGQPVRSNTAAFFKISQARVQEIIRASEQDPEEQE